MRGRGLALHAGGWGLGVFLAALLATTGTDPAYARPKCYSNDLGVAQSCARARCQEDGVAKIKCGDDGYTYGGYYYQYMCECAGIVHDSGNISDSIRGILRGKSDRRD